MQSMRYVVFLCSAAFCTIEAGEVRLDLDQETEASFSINGECQDSLPQPKICALVVRNVGSQTVNHIYPTLFFDNDMRVVSDLIPTGFDLSSGSSLTIRYPKSKEFPTIIEHLFDLKEGPFEISSLLSIWKIQNLGDTPIYLDEIEAVLFPEEEWDLQSASLTALNGNVSESQGTLLVSYRISQEPLPTAHYGVNHFHLGTTENESALEVLCVWEDRATSPEELWLTLGTEAYPRNPRVKPDSWARVAPYFLPADHPLKTKLDQLFSKNRVLLNSKSLKKAGFKNYTPRKYTHVVVTTHPDFPGLVFKLYLDPQRNYKGIPEYEHWIKRIKGVTHVRNQVAEKHWEHLFKTPQKWIYPLPAEPKAPKEFNEKHFILVEEDMQLLDEKDNLNRWKTSEITQEMLDALHFLLSKIGLADCKSPYNLPLAQDGRIAFIDTESYHEWPVYYKNLTEYLSPENQRYWKQITKK